MLNTSFSPWPSYSQDEADIVARVLLSNRVNYWTGQECREFEKEFAVWADCKYAVAVANGTLALELALHSLGVKPGDEVIVPPRTFLATASAVVALGAVPVFADVDSLTQNISPQFIEQVVTAKTKAIICVHLAGWPCDMDAIMNIAEQYDLWVIEDCAQAHGAKYKDKPVGSIGHVGAWSFCQDKIMSTVGEGGMLTTNDKLIWSKAWSYKDHGKSYQAVYEHRHPPGFRWLHESFGSNYRMTEIQAAIGRYQLKQMSEWAERRTHNAEVIGETCQSISGLVVPAVPSELVHAYYKYYVFVDLKQLNSGWSRDDIVNEISARGVPCFQGSCSEIYLEKAFDGMESRPAESLPVAKELGDTSLMFLVHPTLTDQEIKKTCDAIKEVAHEAFVAD